MINNKKFLDQNDMIKCSDYSIDSILDDSCLACAEPYYPIYEDFLRKETFIKCYQDLKGYYLYKKK